VDCTDNVFDAYLGFNKVTVGTEGFTAGALVLGTERGHHDDTNVFGLGR
jgi:hypothetical protein